MEKIKLSTREIEQLSDADDYTFPKYTRQIINLLNSNAQATRPAAVGQMSELIQEFDGKTLEEWIAWYTERYPDAVEKATDRIYAMYRQMSEAFARIDRTMIEAWVKDLLYNKTFCGLKFQGAILAYLADKYHKSWRLADVDEEARGIDGFVGDTPVQIKPASYRSETRLPETIEVPIVYYEKKKDRITIEFDSAVFES